MMSLLLIGVACHLDSPWFSFGHLEFLWPYLRRSSHTTLVLKASLPGALDRHWEGGGWRRWQKRKWRRSRGGGPQLCHVVSPVFFRGWEFVGYLFLKWGTNTLAKMSRWQMMLVWNGSLLTSTTRSELFKQWIYELEHKYWGLDVTHGTMRSCSY